MHSETEHRKSGAPTTGPGGAEGDRLRVALVAPVWTRIPPVTYGGTERVVHLLVEELVRMGHEVTLFSSGDSSTSAALRGVVDRGVIEAMAAGEALEYHHYATSAFVEALRDGASFDVIHCHLGASEIPLGELSAAPVLHTLHSPLTVDDLWVLDRYPRAAVTTASRFQASAIRPERRGTVRVIHHGIDFGEYTPAYEPGRYLAFLGRMGPQKSPAEAIRIARGAGLPIVLAGGPQNADEEAIFAGEVMPLVDGENVVYVGPVDHVRKGELLRNAAALLFPIAGDEAFGLVMIEAMASGTPVLASRRASVTEIVDPGVTGFYAESADALTALVPHVLALDRAAVRAHALDRFGHRRMALEYVDAYRSVVRVER
jgi:glycosyltransferase involved in cell wall biosynthesis